ncbi:hypothetical protein J8I87_13755 [Paraburkholderia sp. LEh10]|uniref:hypothetical protein n=1 Tax=Paraburkholderia sp. LEh10 TaxID=2821353 RepID=UPI001AE4BF32|nr:hypothetical protein [Paraburkholderia sp. LEh10]MBP0590760.1 hypothetical protein [Paraburkholderia sp. LEh10]
MALHRKKIHLMLRLISFCCVTGIFGATNVLAVETGEYFYVQGGHEHGRLNVKDGNFTIDTIGANDHTCSLTGSMKGKSGVVSDGGETCRVAFSGGNGVLHVGPSDTDACRSYCGARAWFDGLYQRPPAACTDRARTGRIEAAREAYTRKNYGLAVAAFTSLIDQCSTYMNWIEADRVRSDLALTQYHLGDKAKCLETLAPTTAMQNRDVDETFGLPPANVIDYQSTGKAILHNAALCG